MVRTSQKDAADLGKGQVMTAMIRNADRLRMLLWGPCAGEGKQKGTEAATRIRRRRYIVAWNGRPTSSRLCPSTDQCYAVYVGIHITNAHQTRTLARPHKHAVIMLLAATLEQEYRYPNCYDLTNATKVPEKASIMLVPPADDSTKRQRLFLHSAVAQRGPGEWRFWR